MIRWSPIFLKYWLDNFWMIKYLIYLLGFLVFLNITYFNNIFSTLYKLTLYTLYLNNAEVRALEEYAKNTIKIKLNQCKFLSINPIYAHIYFII